MYKIDKNQVKLLLLLIRRFLEKNHSECDKKSISHLVYSLRVNDTGEFDFEEHIETVRLILKESAVYFFVEQSLCKKTYKELISLFNL